MPFALSELIKQLPTPTHPAVSQLTTRPISLDSLVLHCPNKALQFRDVASERTIGEHRFETSLVPTLAEVVFVVRSDRCAHAQIELSRALQVEGLPRARIVHVDSLAP